MKSLIVSLTFVCVLSTILTAASKLDHKSQKTRIGKNTCNKTVIYSVIDTEEYKYNYSEPYTGWCWGPPFLCTKYKNKSKTESKEVIVYKNKTVSECCSGYKSIKGKCKPICSNGCVHGQCVEPNNCSCSAGWEGLNCTQGCLDGHYGRSCSNYCLCKNGAKCDIFNGTCYCPEGFTGTYCETSCPENSFGRNCENSCRCKNGARCNPNNGSCTCLPGYIGKFCKEKCLEGTFGMDCKNICKCNIEAAEACSHIDGSCQCRSGWRGTYCSMACKENTWGPLCKNSCDCGLNSSCDRVTGVCSCFPGWHGDKCEKKCPVGFFHKDCKITCPDCAYDPGTCHHETGWCNCPEGSAGPKCDLECPEGKYGKNCMHDCLCANNSICDPITGNCLCLSGWVGQECEFPCPEGKYGQNCNFTCDCPYGGFCDTINGTCNCDEYSKSTLCLKDSMLFEAEVPWLIFIVFIIFLCVIILLCVAVVLCFIRRKRKLSALLKRAKDNNVMTNVTSGENSSPISSQKFMNPAYEAFNNFMNINRRSVAQVPPFKSFRDEDCDQHVLEDDNFKIPECGADEMCKSSDENSKIKIQFQKTEVNHQNRTSQTLPNVTFSKTAENTEDELGVYSSPKYSIYGDVDILKENPYEKVK